MTDQTSAQVFPHLVLATPCSQALQLVIQIVKSVDAVQYDQKSVLTQYIHQEIHNGQQGQVLQCLDAESTTKSHSKQWTRQHLKKKKKKFKKQTSQIEAVILEIASHLPNNNIMVWTRNSNAMEVLYFSSLNQWY